MTDIPILLHQSRFVSLRRSLPEDASFLYEKMYSQTEFTRLFRLNDHVNSEEQLRERLTRNLHIPPTESHYLETLIVHKKHGIIGIAALADYNSFHRRAEQLLGIFEEKYRMSTYPVEANLMLADLAFNAYNLNRLYGYSYGYNQKTQQTITMVFQEEGTMKDHVYDGDTKQFVDLYIHGITLDQFRKNELVARLSIKLLGRDITKPLIQENITPISSEQKPKFIKSGSISLSI